MNKRIYIYFSKKILFLLIFLILLVNFSKSQVNLPIPTIYESYIESQIMKEDSNFHTSIKPYRYEQFKNLSDSNQIFIFNYMDESKTGKSIFKSPLIQIKSKKINIGISPQFAIGGCINIDSNKLILNHGIGVKINGNFTSKLGFEFSYIAYNADFNAYTDSIINNNLVVPGEGTAHHTSLGNSYNSNRIILSYSPNKIFNFQLGNDKNFFGEGYRSLLLSDNATSYPFAKITTNIWKIQYVNLYTQFSEPAINNVLRKKYGTFHYLSWNTTKWLNFSFFETVIWQHDDSTGIRGYDFNYLNPVIFYRPVEFSLGSPDNSLMGLNFSVKPFKKIKLYGQIILDEFSLEHIKAKDGWWANKQGFQTGAKWIDLIGIRNLAIRGELNWVRPFTYSHLTYMQNYGNMHQPLAHPLGANFEEILGAISYCKDRWLFGIFSSLAKYGDDISNQNFGRNIYLPYKTASKEFGNTMLQGSLNKVFNNVVKINYLINPSWNLFAETGICYRTNQVNNNKINSLYIFFSLKTLIHSFNPDFLN